MSERRGNLTGEAEPNQRDEYPPGVGWREEEIEKKGSRRRDFLEISRGRAR